MEKRIYLEPDEEITSVLDRLKKIEADQVILVIPKGAIILQSLVNLKLLAKKAIELKKEIALVTPDRVGRNLASIAGLSVFSEITKTEKIKPTTPVLSTPPSVMIKTYTPVEEERLDEPKPSISKIETPPPKPPRKPFKFPRFAIPSGFWITFIVGLIAFLGILYLLLPQAKIYLQLKTEPYTKSLEVMVDPTASALDIENKILPGTQREQEKSGTKKWAATGEKNIGGKASGTISVINRFKNPDGSGSEISLKPETLFKDKKTGRGFLLASSCNVPRLTYECSSLTGKCEEKPGIVNCKVIAEEAGESYNIGPSEFIIPALGTPSVYGKSEDSMKGGYDKIVNVISEKDVESVRAELKKELSAKAKQEILSHLPKGEKFLEGAFKEEVVKFSTSKNIGDQVKEFEASMTFKITTLTVLEDQYKELLVHYLKKTLPPDKRLVSGPLDTTELSLLSYDPDTSKMRLKITLNTKIAPLIDQMRLKQEIAKKNKDEAKRYLEGLDEIESASIKMWSVSKKLPSSSRIIIQINP